MSEATQDDVIWLTEAKYAELQSELDELRGPTRAAVVQRVSDARDEGDLKENGGYHAARDELGKIDGRIVQLQDMLDRAQVGEVAANDGTVEPGSKVTVRFPALDKTQTFLLGAREMADETVEVFSPQSPLGHAILGAKKGDTVSYETPAGKSMDVEIVETKPYDG